MWPHLLMKSLIENFIFCAVYAKTSLCGLRESFYWLKPLAKFKQKKGNWVWLYLKRAPKSYFTHYSSMVNILFNMGLYQSAFSTYSFRKILFRLSTFYVFSACSLLRIQYHLYRLCIITNLFNCLVIWFLLYNYSS